MVPDAAGISECELNRKVGALVGNGVPVPKFGTSERRNRLAQNQFSGVLNGKLKPNKAFNRR